MKISSWSLLTHIHISVQYLDSSHFAGNVIDVDGASESQDACVHAAKQILQTFMKYFVNQWFRLASL